MSWDDKDYSNAAHLIRTSKGKANWVGGECPEYYKIPLLGQGITVTPFDIIEALDLNFSRGCIVKYCLRAGRKVPGRDGTLADLKKAKNCIEREIARLEAEKP